MDSAGGAEAPKAPPLNPPLTDQMIEIIVILNRYFSAVQYKRQSN